MKNEAQKHFVAALNFLLKQEGHGSQAKLAKVAKIDRSYLNAIVKGKTPGPQDKKEKIAEYFGMRYEEMLSLGRRIISGDSKTISDFFDKPKEQQQLPENKNKQIIESWINKQDNSDEYWTFLKIVLTQSEPDFRLWVKEFQAMDKNTKGANHGNK